MFNKTKQNVSDEKRFSIFRVAVGTVIGVILIIGVLSAYTIIYIGKPMPNKKNIQGIIPEVKDVSLTKDEAIDGYGQNLARWSNNNCAAITINDLPVNFIGPNAGGCSGVYYKYYHAGNDGRYTDTYTSDEAYAEVWGQESLEELQTLRSNIKNLVAESSCSQKKLHNFLLSDFQGISKEVLVEEIGCLGIIEFKATPFGIM